MVVHRLASIQREERYGPVVPYEVAAALPVTLPRLLESDRTDYVYRYVCTCTDIGDWAVSKDMARAMWFNHTHSEAVVADEIQTAEILALVATLAGGPGETSVAWLRTMIETRGA